MNTVTLLTSAEAAPLVAQAAFVFTDIVGSTALAWKVGDARWGEVLREHNAIVRRCVEEFGGEEVSFLGDGFMLMFAAPADAFGCAIELQRRFAAFPGAHPDAPVQLRVGVHTGCASRQGGDVYGQSVHFASRILDAAGPGEVVLSEVVRISLSSLLPRFLRARVVALRGLPGTHRVFAVHSTPPQSLDAAT